MGLPKPEQDTFNAMRASWEADETFADRIADLEGRTPRKLSHWRYYRFWPLWAKFAGPAIVAVLWSAILMFVADGMAQPPQDASVPPQMVVYNHPPTTPPASTSTYSGIGTSYYP